MIWFAVFCLCAYFCALFGFEFWLKKQDPKTLCYRLPAGVGAFVFGVFILGLAFCCGVFGKPTLAVYTWIVGICFAVLYCAARFSQIKAKMIWMPLVCAAGTYVLHKTNAAPVGLLYETFIGVIWLLVMSIVMFFDRLPLLNFLILGTWTLGFTIIVALSGVGSLTIAAVGLLMLAPLWAILNILSRDRIGNFGPYGSALLGFGMGGMIAICLFNYSYASVLAMMSYYIFEILFFVLGLLGLHPLGVERGEFVFSTVLAKNDSKRIISLLFWRLFILSLISALVWKVNKIGIVLIIILVALIDLYNRFNAGGLPPPGIREMWRDTKAGIKNVWQNRHNLFSASQPVVQQKNVKVKKRLTSEKKVPKKTTKRKKKK